MTPRIPAMIPPASRMSSVSYSIRRVVAEARKAEAAGKRIHYLNTGDPVAFGFATPPHMVEAVERALRDGENGYGPSVGSAARRARRWPPRTARRGWPVGRRSHPADRRIVGRHRLRPRPRSPIPATKSSCRCRRIRSTRRSSSKIGAREVYYRTDPANGWLPDPDEVQRLITPRTKAIVVNDPNNPTGSSYSYAIRKALLEIADRHNLPMIADEIYQDVAFDGPIAPDCVARP